MSGSGRTGADYLVAQILYLEVNDLVQTYSPKHDVKAAVRLLRTKSFREILMCYRQATKMKNVRCEEFIFDYLVSMQVEACK